MENFPLEGKLFKKMQGVHCILLAFYIGCSRAPDSSLNLSMMHSRERGDRVNGLLMSAQFYIILFFVLGEVMWPTPYACVMMTCVVCCYSGYADNVELMLLMLTP